MTHWMGVVTPREKISKLRLKNPELIQTGESDNTSSSFLVIFISLTDYIIETKRVSVISLKTIKEW